ncbi:unnamed protein product [Dicrocoelium dendriticum]|nr:unnamed protein product [Dicrocoelium dendriticum]
MTNRALLLDAFDNFSKELSEEYKRANAVRVFEFQAAIKIQAWFRAAVSLYKKIGAVIWVENGIASYCQRQCTKCMPTDITIAQQRSRALGKATTPENIISISTQEKLT